jgi:3'(2'), 5'-bisphosphate nucleotidase
MEEIKMDSLNLPFVETFPETELALRAVLKAGDAIAEIYQKDFSVEIKSDNSPLTEADTKSSQIIFSALKESGYPTLSEEVADNDERMKARLVADKVWIFDPLDGTKEFVNRINEFSILLGLIENGAPILGIIHQPITKTIFVAQKEGGAFMKTEAGWEKLEASNIDNFSHAVALCSRNHLSANDKRFFEYLGLQKFSPYGSSGLKAGEICRKNAEFYFNSSQGLKQWDTCAASCLLAEAGGKMTDMFGNELKYNISETVHKEGVLISNGVLHNEIVKSYKEYLKLKEK